MLFSKSKMRERKENEWRWDKEGEAVGNFVSFIIIQEGGIYLIPKQDSTQKFLRSRLLGKKLYVKWEDVSVIKIPQYKGLHVKDLLRFAENKISIYVPSLLWL